MSEGTRLGASDGIWLGASDGNADGLAVPVPTTRTDLVVEKGFGFKKLSAEM